MWVTKKRISKSFVVEFFFYLRYNAKVFKKLNDTKIDEKYFGD